MREAVDRFVHGSSAEDASRPYASKFEEFTCAYPTSILCPLRNSLSASAVAARRLAGKYDRRAVLSPIAKGCAPLSYSTTADIVTMPTEGAQPASSWTRAKGTINTALR